MGFYLRHFLFSLVAFIGVFILWVIDQTNGQSFSNYFFPLLGEKTQRMITDFAFIFTFALALAKLINDIQISSKPTPKFRYWVRKKIKQGERLLKKWEWNDEFNQTPYMPISKLRSENLLEEYNKQLFSLEPFAKCFSKWKYDTHRVLKNFIGKESDLIKVDALIESQTIQHLKKHHILGGYRYFLRLELNMLQKFKHAKKDWFVQGYDVELLEEYEELKCLSENTFHWKKLARKNFWKDLLKNIHQKAIKKSSMN